MKSAMTVFTEPKGGMYLHRLQAILADVFRERLGFGFLVQFVLQTLETIDEIFISQTDVKINGANLLDFLESLGRTRYCHDIS